MPSQPPDNFPLGLCAEPVMVMLYGSMRLAVPSLDPHNLFVHPYPTHWQDSISSRKGLDCVSTAQHYQKLLCAISTNSKCSSILMFWLLPDQQEGAGPRYCYSIPS